MLATDVKSIFRSLTVGGGLLAAIPGIDQLLVQLGLIDQPTLGKIVDGFVALAGFILVVWGRVRAVQKVRLLP